MSGPYKLFLFDDCCHLWTSTDTGATFTEFGTPNPTQDTKTGIGTLIDQWSDMTMAINDGDYDTLVAWDSNYRLVFGIIEISHSAGSDLSDMANTIDYEQPAQAFNPVFDSTTQVAIRGASSANAEIILAPIQDWSSLAGSSYPRLSIDGGATWNDVTGLPADTVWQAAAFGANATPMYIKQYNDHIQVSTDIGTTWTPLTTDSTTIDNGIFQEGEFRLRCNADGSVVGYMVKTGHFEFSTDGGATWTEIDFTARTGNAAGRYCDFGVTPDGNTLIVCFEQIISAGNWPAVFVSTDRGSSWTDISANLLYPVSSGGPPGGVPTGCSSCNVAPDGLGMVVTFEYTDNPHTEPDGLTGYTTYANVSIDAGATFTLCSFDADPLQVGSALGLFTATFIVGPPTPPPPGPTSPGGYIIERLDNRIWPTVEDCWCVDCAFTLARPQPAADIQMSTATGAGILTGVTSLNGGHNYSASTTATVVDDNGLGPGTGAVAVLTIVSGVITAIAFSPAGSGYVYPQLVFNDPENTGSGASATITIDNTAMFIASAPVFVVGDVGSVIRCGLGVATITEFLDAEHVIANITSPIVQVKEDDPLDPYTPITFLSGTWTMTAPITQFRIPQLAGFEITGLADGQIIPPTLVPANGLVTLAQPASAIIVGLAFQAQLQSTYLDAGEPTVQGQRKKIAEVTVRVEQSAAFQIGGNQPDGSVQSPQQLAPLWQNMVDAPTHAVAPFGSTALPLYTGDIRIPTPSGYNTRGQIAVQQLNPLPLQVLDYVPEVLAGDKASQEAPKREPPQNGRKGR